MLGCEFAGGGLSEAGGGEEFGGLWDWPPVAGASPSSPPPQATRAAARTVIAITLNFARIEPIKPPSKRPSGLCLAEALYKMRSRGGKMLSVHVLMKVL